MYVYAALVIFMHQPMLTENLVSSVLYIHHWFCCFTINLGNIREQKQCWDNYVFVSRKILFFHLYDQYLLCTALLKITFVQESE